MKPAPAKTVDPSTLSLDTLRGLAEGRKAKGDGRLLAIIGRGDAFVQKNFPNTCKQAQDPKNKSAKAEIDKIVLREVQARAVKHLRANP